MNRQNYQIETVYESAAAVGSIKPPVTNFSSQVDTTKPSQRQEQQQKQKQQQQQQQQHEQKSDNPILFPHIYGLLYADCVVKGMYLYSNPCILQICNVILCLLIDCYFNTFIHTYIYAYIHTYIHTYKH